MGRWWRLLGGRSQDTVTALASRREQLDVYGRQLSFTSVSDNVGG